MHNIPSNFHVLSSTDSFVVSQLFMVARLYSRWDRNQADFTSVGYFSPRAIVIFTINEGILYIYFSTYTLSASKSTKFIYIYIYILKE